MVGLPSHIPTGITGVGSAIYAVERPDPASGNDAVAYINNWKLVSQTSDNESRYPGGLTAGPDHRLYFPFTENSPATLGTFDTKTKKFSQINLAKGYSFFNGGAITTAPDGTIWSAADVAYGYNCYVEHTLSTRKSVGYLYFPYVTSGSSNQCTPQSIVVGPDSRLWWPGGNSYSKSPSKGFFSPPVYAMTSSGTLSQYAIPSTKQGSYTIVRQLQNLVPASDGNLWAAVELWKWSGESGSADGCEILRISTSGKVKEYKINAAVNYCQWGLAVDKAGFLWMPAYLPGSDYTIYLVRSSLIGQMTIFKFLSASDAELSTALPFVDKAGYVYYGYEDIGTQSGAIVRFKPQDAK
jgi:hypothetical protein